MERSLFAILLLAVTFKAAGRQDAIQWNPPAQPVYAIFPNHRVDGGGPPSTRFGDLLMVQIYPAVLPPKDLDDARRLYDRGKLVPLYMDGQRRGNVRIEDVKEHHCDGAAALVVPTLGGVSKKVTGLATNAELRSREGKRREAIPSERTAAVQAATREFLRNKTPRSLLTRIRIDTLTAIEVDNSKAVTLIASFFIHTRTERHDVFLILQAGASRLSTQYSRYRQTQDLDDFKDHESVSFVDHLDLNRDGTDEIVLEVGAYESEKYEIYSRQRDNWHLVATGGEAGC